MVTPTKKLCKKNIHRENQNRNLLKDVKVYFKNKKELDKYTGNEDILHQGYVAELEHLDNLSLKDTERVNPGDSIQIRLSKGSLDCTVKKIIRE